MSEGLRGVVVSHGGLAAAMVQAVEQISGVTGVLFPVSNTGCDPESIERRLSEAIGQGPAVVFVDLPSGSCFFAAMRAHKSQTEIPVVTGVNLPMLVDFVFHRGVSAEEAARRAAAKGGEAIRTR
jgi:mannose/fructose-specific phosphotransferase system component IIA